MNHEIMQALNCVIKTPDIALEAHMLAAENRVHACVVQNISIAKVNTDSPVIRYSGDKDVRQAVGSTEKYR